MNLRSVTKSELPQIRINLSLPPKVRWIHAGEEHSRMIRELVDQSWDYLMEYFDDSKFYERILLKPFVSRAGGPLGTFVGHGSAVIGGEYANELKGYAKGAGVSYGKAYLLNLSYDISQFVQGGGTACSSASYTDSRGRPILARNLDWSMPPGLGRYTALIEFSKGSRSYQSIGFLGFVGVLSAMKKGAWAVTLNQAPVDQKILGRFQFPACMHLRNSCDDSGTFRKLKRSIADFRPLTPFLAHLIGTNRSEQTLLQHTGPYCWETDWTKDSGCLAQTNHFLDPEEGFEINEKSGWGSNCERLKRIQSRLRKGGYSTLEDGFRLMKESPVTNEDTIQQLVMRPATGSLKLKAQI